MIMIFPAIHDVSNPDLESTGRDAYDEDIVRFGGFVIVTIGSRWVETGRGYPIKTKGRCFWRANRHLHYSYVQFSSVI